MNQIPSTLLEPPAPARTGKEPPGSAPDTPFAAVLADHQARTAVAEGHERAPVDPDAGSEERGGDDASPVAPDAVALATLLGGVPLAAEVAVTTEPLGGTAEPGPHGGRVDRIPPTQTFREQAREIVLTRATRPIGVPADATSLPLRPPVSTAEGAADVPATASSPSLPIGPGVAGVEGGGDVAGVATEAMPAAARATRLAEVLQAATARPATTGAEATTPSPATAAGVAGRAQAAADGQPSAQAAKPATPATPATPAATPVVPSAHAPSAPATTLAPSRGVGLEHAVETVRLALRAGAERGVSHARISLTPRELGTIEIHLRQTPDGLVARVAAEHSAAVQQLQQAGGDLRRQLEQSGVNVLRLDIGASGEQGGRSANRHALAGDAGASGGRDGRRAPQGDDPLAALDGPADPNVPTATLTLPNGALVDVLA